MARRSQTPPPPPPKSEAITVQFPEGRLINHALFEKDAFTNPQGVPGTPKYKVEMAYDMTPEFEAVIDLVAQECIAEYGDNAVLDIDVQAGDDVTKINIIKSPFLSGDKLAAKREKKGKEGDAYKGKTVIRADSIYNKDGVDGPGGMSVYDESVQELPFQERGKIFPGMYGMLAGNLSFYQNADGEDCCKFYLVAFQRTRGEATDKLSTGADRSTLFKPVGRAAGAATGGRRSRAG